MFLDFVSSRSPSERGKDADESIAASIIFFEQLAESVVR